MTKPLTLNISTESFAYREPFRIAGHVFHETRVVVARLSDGTHTGRGEAAGVYFMGDDVAAMTAAMERVRPAIEAGADRAALQTLLPPGGARNALDCAFWELEAKRAGAPVWQLAGVPEPRPLRTTITLGAAEPAAMAAAAERLTDAHSLKLKLTGEWPLDAERVAAVRAARPECWIAVDANQGYAIEGLAALTQRMVELGVELIEQPLARGCEDDLDGAPRPIPVAADESVLSLAEIDRATGRFDTINIKLDKCGGLTEGLALARAARDRGFDVMVGNMMGTSLAMAPAFVLGQLCDVVDLDGPTFLAADRDPGVTYANGDIHCDAAVWGS